MAYRYGNRYQANMFPESIEEYVASDDPVRAYDAFVETVKIKELGIKIDTNKEGCPQYDPRAMIKLLLYGYSYGIRSSRKLERAIYHNVSFIWLMGGLKPDHKTISEFRKNNKKALSKIIKQCARICIKLGLIEGNTLFMDGTKIRANASIGKTLTEAKAKQLLENIDKRIEQILNECDAEDAKEEKEGSHVKLRDELNNEQLLKKKIEDAIQELEKSQKKSINTVDKECVKTKGRQGIHAGYNGQIVVDEKYGLIINSDVVAESNDTNQFSSQLEQAEEVVGHKCKVGCADAGYANTDNLKQMVDKNIKVIVPTKDQAHNRTTGPFAKDKFTYDDKRDCYICPEGKRLDYNHFDSTKNRLIYLISDKKKCFNCKHYGICTNAKNGRQIKRLVNEKTKQELEQMYKKPSSQQIYLQRKEKVEHPFGHLKRNLGFTQFLLRGLDAVKAEMSLSASCFNIARMISLTSGVENLIAKLSI